MISDRDIARWRLRSQHLVEPHPASAVDVVGSLLAVQAENAGQSAWAVASRTADPSQDDVRSALADGRLIRTHVLRPTWHYVRNEDLGWLLALTGPRVLRTTGAQLRATLEISDRQLASITSMLLELLNERPDRTRGEVAEGLRERGVDLDGQRLMIVLAHLELDRLIASGRPRAEEHTYALFADRVPTSRELDREGALRELALRYFTGHGPATERDLSYWATLTLTDARRAIELAADGLDRFGHDGGTFWHAPGDPPTRRGAPAAHLLQILDEMYRGYQDSRWVIDAEGSVPRVREATLGMALADGQLVSAVRRKISGDRVVFALSPHRPLQRWEIAGLRRAGARYGTFLDLDATVELP